MGKKNKHKKDEKIKCVVYLSTLGDIKGSEYRERKQLNYIKDYAKAHNIIITKIIRRSVLGQFEANRQFQSIIALVKEGQADGILVASMKFISRDIPDAYEKVSAVTVAGGVMVTVDEGELKLHLKM